MCLCTAKNAGMKDFGKDKHAKLAECDGGCFDLSD